MSSDPIKLIQGILPKTPAATATKSSTATASEPAANQTAAYKLSKSLTDLLNQGGSASGASSLSNYTVQGLKENFQAAHEEKLKASASSAAKPLDKILATSNAQGTNATTASSEVKEILKDKKAVTADPGLAAIDSRLAQTVGISRAIGTA